MKSLKHYLVCAGRIIKNKIKTAGQAIKRNKEKRKAIKECKQVIQHGGRKIVNTVEFAELRSDTGKLCEQKGFLFDKTVDLSIIIPLYNVENYIEECIQSVLTQKTKYTYEMILVDDGSTDGTLDRVQPFLTDKRIMLIKQENQGQSVARNNAIAVSHGKYIMMLDGDDVLLNGAVEVLMDTATQTGSDIAEGAVTRFYHELNLEDISKSKKHQIKSNRKNPHFVLSCYGYSVAKVYKRELWETLRYPEGYIFEDVISKFILRRKANQVAFVDYTVYGYRQNMQSSSHGSNISKKLDSIWVFPKIKSLCESENAPMDNVFYMLSLNHIGLLNSVVLKNQEEQIKKAAFLEMQKQLKGIQEYRPKKLPKMFELLEKTILDGNLEGWQLVANTINKYGLLKKWREIN